jgi:hypothetical protein
LENPWEGAIAGLVLGDMAWRKINEEEQTPARRMRRRSRWEDLLKAAEESRGEAWAEWSKRHGDWGRDAVMHVAVHHGGLRLAEVVQHVGLKYQAAAQAVK